jgi:uncharacterized protein YmfQ (DUF2313 family)
MNKAVIVALMEQHSLTGLTLNGAGQSGVERMQDGRWKLTFDGMPNLPFFVALAKLAGVSIESIQTTSEESYGGCDTCGYGAGTEYFAYVPTAKPKGDE